MPEQPPGTDDATAGVPPGVDPGDEVVLALYRLLAQARDESIAPVSRITAAVNARTFLEQLTRRLVNAAREAGSTWDEIGLLFGTSAINAKARFGDYNRYDDEDDQ